MLPQAQFPEPGILSWILRSLNVQVFLDRLVELVVIFPGCSKGIYILNKAMIMP